MKNILIITISLVFATSCNESESKQTTNNDALKNAIIEKVTDVIKEAEVHVHKTTEWDSKLRLYPNSPDALITIPKGTEVEILAEQLVKQGMLENTWYKVTYENKIGWVSEHNFNK